MDITDIKSRPLRRLALVATVVFMAFALPITAVIEVLRAAWEAGRDKHDEVRDDLREAGNSVVEVAPGIWRQ